MKVTRQFLEKYLRKDDLIFIAENIDLDPSGTKRELTDKIVKHGKLDFYDLEAYLLKDDLKEICDKMGLAVSGTKIELVQRIIDEYKDSSNQFYTEEESNQTPPKKTKPSNMRKYDDLDAVYEKLELVISHEKLMAELDEWNLGFIVTTFQSSKDIQIIFFLKSKKDPLMLVRGDQILNNNHTFDSLTMPKDVFYQKLKEFTSYFPTSNKLFTNDDLTKSYLTINESELKSLLELKDILENLNFQIYVDRNILAKNVSKMRPQIRFVSQGITPLEFDVIAAIGDQEINLSQIDEQSKILQPYVEFQNRFFHVSNFDKFIKIVERIQSSLKKLDNIEKIRLKNGDIGVLPPTLKTELEKDEIEIIPYEYNDISVSEIQVDPAILAKSVSAIKLKDYQKTGVARLLAAMSRKSYNFFLLADDMGMGKTIQTLVSLTYLKLTRKLNNPVLLIVPFVQIFNEWETQIINYAPALNYLIYHSSRHNEISRQTNKIQVNDLVITTIQTFKINFNSFNRYTWDGIIIDEASKCIRNPETQNHRAIIKFVKANPKAFRLALTGTPIENRLQDLWAVFRFLEPGYLLSQKKFHESFGTEELDTSSPKFELLLNLIYPFILYRRRTDFLDLPPLEEIKVSCTLTQKQIVKYKTWVNLFEKSLGTNMEQSGRVNLILKTIIRLKQIANHPASIEEEIDLNTVNKKDSGKVLKLIELLKKHKSQGEKCIIFTQFVNTGKILQKIIKDEFGGPVLFYFGGLTANKRQETQQLFNENPDYWVMVISTHSGSFGLNLQAGTVVIHFDRWWNPAVENQGTARIHRIGQKEKVTAYKLITKGTIEEQIDALLESKLKQNAILEQVSTMNELKAMSNDKLKEILRYKDT